MKNVIEWIKQSNRWKHLLGGVLVGLGSSDLYCAVYSGVGIASALELKDKLWGSTIDIVDCCNRLWFTLCCYLINKIGEERTEDGRVEYFR